MGLYSILPGVSVRQCLSAPIVDNPAYTGENIQVSQKEFATQVEGVGSFYAREGSEVIFSTLPGADPEWVKLYLNGQVLVALLHQRGIINFHASSFIHSDRGIMILGETGAGKSSITASFALNGGGFLSDDLTPVIFRDAKPHIWTLNREIKLRENTVRQLKLSRNDLRDAEAGTGKLYMKAKDSVVADFTLDAVLKIEIGDTAVPEFHTLSSAEKFSLLRSEICSWEILAGMQETEAAYLQQLVEIIRQVRFVKVVRPAEIRIVDLQGAVEEYLVHAIGNRQ